MVAGWLTWLLVAFGILVAVAGVIAYLRMVSRASSEDPPSTQDWNTEEKRDE